MGAVSRSRLVPGALVAGLLVLACGPNAERYEARGVVQEVSLDFGQVVIEHDEIEGLMPAMTMSFDVPDRALLARLAPGQVVAFEIERSGRRLRVVAADVVGEASPQQGWVRLGDGLVRSDPAPRFTLTDQEGRPFGSDDLDGRVVLLDFVYTTCTGPCPILTSFHVSVQQRIAPGLADRIHFVSISLDPLRDDPAALRTYALERGADLSRWSFLTGPVADVEAVTRQFGVGSTRQPDGSIDHMVVSFLIDGGGRIVKRYFGLEHEAEALAQDLESLASS